MNDTIQQDTTLYLGKGYGEYDTSKGQFIPEQKTDFIYTTTAFKEDIYTAFIAEAFYISLGIANLVFLILIWRKLKKIEKKLG
jgi:cell division protein FtsW (lipid II flippase)